MSKSFRKIGWLLAIVMVVSQLGLTAPYANTDAAGPYSLKAVSVVAATGGDHVLVVLEDGSVLAWGENRTGQIGNSTAGNTYSVAMPVYEQNGGLKRLSNVAEVVAGAQFSLALKKDGTVWSWGMDASSELGRPTDGYVSAVAGQVQGLRDIVQISAGDTHSLALDKDGNVWAWGDNLTGGLGTGSMGAPQSVPVRVMSLTDVVQVSAGTLYSLALTADGKVYAWGYNGNRQTGDGVNTNQPRLTPVNVKKSDGQPLSGVTQIAAGSFHGLAILNDDTVWSWGSNSFGQLGSGDQSLGVSARQVMLAPNVPLNGVRSVGAGRMHSLAIRQDKTLWAWGSNSNGQLGKDPALAYSVYPLKMTETEDGSQVMGVRSAGGGNEHTTIMKEDGTVWGVGRNDRQQLGGNRTEGALSRLFQTTLAVLSKTYWTNNPSVPVTLGESANVMLQLADYWGGAVKFGTDRVTMEASSGTLGPVNYAGDGQFTASFTPNQLGETEVKAKVNGLDVPAKLKLQTYGVPDMNQSSIHSSASIATAGMGSVTLTVYVRDQMNHLLTMPAGRIGFSTTLGNIQARTVTGAAYYQASLSSTVTGTSTVTFSIDGQPFLITTVRFAAGDPSSAHSALTANPDRLPADGASSTEIVLLLKDANGNALTQSGGAVTFETDLGRFTNSVTETTYGVYRSNLVSDAPGAATVTAKRNGVTVSAPVTVHFTKTITSVAFDTSDYELEVGETSQTKVHALYNDGSQTDITAMSRFVIQDNGIANVSANGSLTAVAAGSTVLTATYGGFQANVAVKVKAKPDPEPIVDGIGFAAGSYELEVGETVNPTVTAHYANGSERDVTAFSQFTVRDSGVAQVGGDGMVTGVAAGSTVLTATYGGFHANAAVKVKAKPDPEPVVDGIEFVANSYELEVGETVSPTVKAHYTNGSERDVTAFSQFTVRDSGVAQVAGNGTVTGRAAGETVLTATYGGFQANVAVKVKLAGNGGGTDPGTDPDPETDPGSGTDSGAPPATGTDSGSGTNPDSGSNPDPGTTNPGTNLPGGGESGTPAPSETISFSDVAGHWAYFDIRRAAQAGMISGYPDGTFRPEEHVTRAEFVVMLSRLLGLPESQANRQPVSGETWPEWANGAIDQAMAAGIVSGYEDGTFRPDSMITRSEMAVMLMRAAAYAGWTVPSSGGNPIGAFSDGTSVPEWARDAFSAALNAAVLVGDDTASLHPLNSTTRAEAVTVLLRLLELQMKS
ncbi:S-layer homology domain-containing protein [Paenibacillus allorhizosphaerae]|uniref:RCC1 domain-containing protein n=1 Tax=Paenibacillus allorhizosphaerae TaxID=2849866 RepID=UPI001C404897|nr:invasin domain 3-containing protein [Paenibacillus allorhizosphaerae]